MIAVANLTFLDPDLFMLMTFFPRADALLHTTVDTSTDDIGGKSPVKYCTSWMLSMVKRPNL